MSLTKATYSMIQGAAYNVLDYGADPTGVVDSQSACQAAITAAQAGGGGTVVIPEGTYLISGVAGSDATLNGLLVPYVSANGTSGRVIIQGQGRSTILKANSNNMYVIRFSDSHGGVRDLTIDGNGKSAVIGLGCVPENTTQTSTLVFQLYNIFSGLYITSCDEGFKMKTGPDVGGADSGCWYNVLRDTHIFSCTRGIWLQDGPNVNCSPCNRNTFINVRCGQNMNTGLQIDAGDTNKFFSVNFEGITAGVTPNATPTAIYIRQTSPVGGFDNNGNAFFGTTCEANTQDLENYNSRTQSFGCYYLPAKVKQTGGAGYGLIVLGGDDPSVVPQIYGGGTYQSNGQVAGLNNGITFKTLSGTAGVLLDSTIYTTQSVQEKNGFSGNIANGATFVIAIPTPRRPQLLFVYSGVDLAKSALFMLCGDGSGNITVSTIVSSISVTVVGTAGNQVTVTNGFGTLANLLYTLTPFGAAVPP